MTYKVGVVCGLMAVLLCLTSCGLFFPSDPGIGGYTGISRDEAGSPVAHIAMCDGQVDELWLGPYDARLADLTTESPVTASAEVDLAHPGNDWTARTPLQPLEPGAGYSIGARAHNWEWVTESTTFTTADLAQLEPGQVLWTRYDSARDTDSTLTSSIEDFHATACTR